jgi:hypothetical protein
MAKLLVFLTDKPEKKKAPAGMPPDAYDDF